MGKQVKGRKNILNKGLKCSTNRLFGEELKKKNIFAGIECWFLEIIEDGLG